MRNFNLCKDKTPTYYKTTPKTYFCSKCNRKIGAPKDYAN